MITLIFRTLLVYIFLIIIMRLMGKRQIGELEVTDLVATLLLSEIASLPITDPNIPVLHAIIPMIVLLSLEVFSSYILIRTPKLKNLLSATPTILIKEGVLDQAALVAVRLSIEELMSEIRQQGFGNLAYVWYAILEKDGKLTILPRSRYAPPTQELMNLTSPEESLMHLVYNGNVFNDAGLALIGKDRAWLEKQMERRGVSLADQFCVTANTKGELYWIPKKERG
ncbi:MAG: DUF421 domain-containing protein [Clostridia bacterium]|nr:DUF421 domain-containing protein [Clostridia bacterium]